jgi:hypothetical protein
MFALALGACESSIMYSDADSTRADDEDYVHGPAPLKGAEFDALWARAELVLTMDGQQIDRDRTRYDQRQMVTHWDTRLAPNRFEGKRSRAWIRFEPLKSGDWDVAVAVQMQRNADIDQPSAASQAKWEEAPSNTARADVLLWKIESGFRDENAEKGAGK